MKRGKRDKYINQMQKELFKVFEEPMRSMTVSQGALLMKLIDREIGKTSFNIIKDYKNGVTEAECFRMIHTKYDEHQGHDWCHTISNAIIVAAALLYGEGIFGRSICLAVQTGFDTDCNGATVGSVLGMRNGTAGISEEWTDPLHDKLHTSIFGVGTVSIAECAEKTMMHLPNGK